jgi:hypothetical protein
MKAEDWVSAFAREIGVETPSLEEFDLLLALAAVAARCSNKTAAPAACWVAARSEKPLGELLDAAERIGSS